MKYELTVSQLWEMGQRANQEDCLYPAYGEATEQDRLFILCDGMGGHQHGEVASQTVCRTMGTWLQGKSAEGLSFTEEVFRQSLEAAYEALDASDKEETGKKMGTTLAFLMLHEGGAFIAHIGDSRVYQFRPTERRIVFQTRDHSLVNDLVSVGEITPEEARHHRQKNIITRAMQPHQEQRAKADVCQTADVRAGDYFLLCSDGLLEELEDQNLVNILSDGQTSDAEKMDILRQVSRDSRDNHSALLIHIRHLKEKVSRQGIGTWLGRLFNG